MKTSVGLTKLYGMMHDPDTSAPEIHDLRELHKRLSIETLAAYGWSDLSLDYGFYEVSYLPENDRVRFTMSEPARVELLRRLSELNRQRYEEEVEAGLHGSKTTVKATRKPGVTRAENAHSRQPSFDFDGTSANDGNYRKAAEQRDLYQAGPTHAIVECLKAHPGWHAKSDIQASTGITDGQWNAAIADLIPSGRIERQGEKRGARYRVVKEGAKE